MTSIRVFGIGQLLTVLPYQFGFYPRDSLLACLFSDGLLGTIRLDGDAAAELGPHALARSLISHAHRLEATHVVLLDYDRMDATDPEPGESGRPMPGDGLVDATLTECLRLGLDVQHVLHVRGDSWWASRCSRGCCNGSLRRIPAAEDVPAVAEYVLRGVSPAVSRGAAIASLRGQDPQAQAAVRLEMLTRHWDHACILEEWEALRASAHDPTHPVPDDMLAAVLEGLSDVWLRDELMASLVPELMGLWDPPAHECDLEEADAMAMQLLRLLPRVPHEERARWLSLLALARWRSNDLPGAQLAVGVALENDSELTIARLVWQLLSVQVRYLDFVRGHTGPMTAMHPDEGRSGLGDESSTWGRFETG